MKFIGFVFFFFLFHTAYSKDVVIWFGLSKPPYVNSETQSGLEYEIVEQAFKAVGYTLKPSFAPLSRGDVFLRTKEVDGVATKRKDFTEGFFPSENYVTYHNYAFSLKSKPLHIKSISDLKNYSVRAFQTAKTLLGPEFKAMAEANPKYAEVANQELQIAQLFGNRTEVIIGDDRVMKYFFEKLKKEEGLTGEMISYDIFPLNHYAVVFHDAKMRDTFNQGLALIHKNKTYEKIIQKYSK